MKRPPSYSEGYISELQVPHDFKTNLLVNNRNSIDSSIVEETGLIDTNIPIVKKNEYIGWQ